MPGRRRGPAGTLLARSNAGAVARSYASANAAAYSAADAGAVARSYFEADAAAQSAPTTHDDTSSAACSQYKYAV